MPQTRVEMVDYRQRPQLARAGMAFHWWDTIATSLHRHNHYEFFIITRGKTGHILNGEAQTLHRNTLFLLQPDDCHQFQPVDGFLCTHMNLAFVKEKLEAVCSVLGIRPNTLWEGAAPLPVVLTGEEMEFFTARAGRLGFLSRGVDAGTAAADLLTGELITEAVATLYKRRGLESSGIPEWFSRLLQEIHSPDFLDKNAEDVYQFSGYSPPAILRYFRQYTGKTIVAYLTGLKMEHACGLFSSTESTTLEVAGRLGYDSLSHFNRLFKQYTGMTPTGYRKSLTE